MFRSYSRRAGANRRAELCHSVLLYGFQLAILVFRTYIAKTFYTGEAPTSIGASLISSLVTILVYP